MKLSEELKWRGLVNQTTYDDLSVLDGTPISFYLGVDPSSDSMQVGNLAAVMLVRRLTDAGHKAHLLVGGATGMIGDPDGKKQERDLKTPEQIDHNKKMIAAQYKQLLGESFELVDNYDWFKGINYLEFLRDVGKNVPMRQMLGREFVDSRLKEGGAGISYAEFSYVLIQAYDFLHLFREHDVTLQVCGADQWGNCIAGVDLIRRKTGQEANVFSIPLVVNKSTGRKFGKTEGGAVWLDARKTSPYKFYQFWLNTDDASVVDFLKIYTLLEKSEIEKILSAFKTNPGGRLAQRVLAYEVTKIVHGEEQANSVRNASEVLFGDKDFLQLSAPELEILKSELLAVTADENLAKTVAAAGLAGSISEANRLIASGAVSVNGQKAESNAASFQKGANLLKRGKNQFAIVEK